METKGWVFFNNYKNTNCIFLIHYDITTNELTFRTGKDIEKLQKEVGTVKNDFIFTKDYNFHISFLQKFLYENDLIKPN